MINYKPFDLFIRWILDLFILIPKQWIESNGKRSDEFRCRSPRFTTVESFSYDLLMDYRTSGLMNPSLVQLLEEGLSDRQVFGNLNSKDKMMNYEPFDLFIRWMGFNYRLVDLFILIFKRWIVSHGKKKSVEFSYRTEVFVLLGRDLDIWLVNSI
ncbi:hypothetical protein OROHE_024305 [Orobanche hederae]